MPGRLKPLLEWLCLRDNDFRTRLACFRSVRPLSPVNRFTDSSEGQFFGEGLAFGISGRRKRGARRIPGSTGREGWRRRPRRSPARAAASTSGLRRVRPGPSRAVSRTVSGAESCPSQNPLKSSLSVCGLGVYAQPTKSMHREIIGFDPSIFEIREVRKSLDPGFLLVWILTTRIGRTSGKCKSHGELDVGISLRPVRMRIFTTKNPGSNSGTSLHLGWGIHPSRTCTRQSNLLPDASADGGAPVKRREPSGRRAFGGPASCFRDPTRLGALGKAICDGSAAPVVRSLSCSSAAHVTRWR